LLNQQDIVIGINGHNSDTIDVLHNLPFGFPAVSHPHRINPQLYGTPVINQSTGQRLFLSQAKPPGDR
jgi:hypothetical protein